MRIVPKSDRPRAVLTRRGLLLDFLRGAGLLAILWVVLVFVGSIWKASGVWIALRIFAGIFFLLGATGITVSVLSIVLYRRGRILHVGAYHRCSVESLNAFRAREQLRKLLLNTPYDRVPRRIVSLAISSSLLCAAGLLGLLAHH